MTQKIRIERIRIGISRVYVVMIFALLCMTESYWSTSFPPLTSAMVITAIVLVIIASVGRLWCSLYIAGYKTDHLVTQGPYSMCRNPLYFFSFIGAAGVGLATETFLIPVLIVTAFAVYYPLVIKDEEQDLKRRHKESFEQYEKQVPRFFPKLSLLREPASYQVNPVIFKNHIFDVIWFGFSMGILEIIEECHRLDLFPSILKIY